jgi:hypothetical protein
MISAVPGQEPMIRIHETVSSEETDPHYPALWRSSMFELVSDAMPSNWRVALGGEDSPGYLRIGPTSWLREGFWDDIFDWSPGSEEAREDYSRELAIILAESRG